MSFPSPSLPPGLATPPFAGSGVHTWGFAAACALRRQGAGDLQILSFLESAVAHVGRRVPTRELRNWVDGSARAVGHPSQVPARNHTPSIPRPTVDLGQLQELWRDGPLLVELWELSPYRLLDIGPAAEELIDLLLPGNGSQLLCVGATQSQFDTRTRDEWRGRLGQRQFVVPALMTARRGLTADGRLSAHAKSLLEPTRRWLVVECDFKLSETPLGRLVAETCNRRNCTPPDLCVPTILALAKYWPLAAVVHSGGKSLHAWFPCHTATPEIISAFITRAIQLGADPAPLRNPAQFVRMPEGTRQPGKVRQALQFLNPSVLQ